MKRFLLALKASDPMPFRRMQVLPGAEAQVDFAQGVSRWTHRSQERHLLGPTGVHDARGLGALGQPSDSHLQPSIRIDRDPARAEEGRFSTQQKHISSKKIFQVEQGADYLLARERRIGPASERWARAVLTERKVEALRPLIRFLSLCKKHEARGPRGRRGSSATIG